MHAQGLRSCALMLDVEVSFALRARMLRLAVASALRAGHAFLRARMRKV